MVEPRSGAGAQIHYSFKTRVLDIDIQTQIAIIQDMSKLRTYKLLKHEFGCGEYMFCITNRSFRIVFSKLRGGFLRNACTEGRNNNRSFDVRLCPLRKTDCCIWGFLIVQ